MSERPNVVLALLFGAATLLAALVGAGLIALGGAGVLGLTAMVIGAFSACIYFLAELHRVPLAPLFLVTLSLLSLCALIRATLTYRRERRLLLTLPLEEIQGELAEVAHTAGAVALYRTPAARPAAFCFGLRSPRIVLTDGLLERLDPEECAAAIWHEAEHARVREPLKCLAAGLAARMFFWMPLLADLLDRYLLVKELEADRFALEQTSRTAIAGALCEVLGEPTPAGAVGLADFAGARIERLFDSQAALPPISSRLRIALSVGAATAFALVLAFPAPLDLGEANRLHSMLTSMSLHGLPGMIVGFLINALLFTGMSLVARRAFLRQR